MRVLVCGSKRWTDREAIRRELETLPAGTTIIHGAAPGADRIAGELGLELGFAVEAYPAEWDKYGRQAGPIRNRQMLREGKPELVLAFTKDLTRSTGTADMIRQARGARVKVRVFGVVEQGPSLFDTF